MKKLLLSAAFTLATLASFAQGNAISFTNAGTAYAFTGNEVTIASEDVEDQPAHRMITADITGRGMVRTQMGITFQFYLPTGAALKPGKYPLIAQNGYAKKMPCVYVLIAKMLPDNVYGYSPKAATDGVVEVTAVNGNVVEGTFAMKLPYRTGTPRGTFVVEKGTFRFELP